MRWSEGSGASIRSDKDETEEPVKHLISLTFALCLSAAPAFAADSIKATIGQRGNWDTAIIHLGTKAGIFARHNLEIEPVYTSGSGETLQPVISGSVDLG